MEKRKWVYAMKPTTYGIVCDICEGNDLEWSEYLSHVWCYDCQKDTKGKNGIFTGPVPIQTACLLGMCFDRIDLETKKRLYMHIDGDGVSWHEEMQTGEKS